MTETPAQPGPPGDGRHPGQPWGKVGFIGLGVMGRPMARNLLAGDQAVRSVVGGELIPAARPGTLLIDMSTVSPALSRELAARAASRGVSMIVIEQNVERGLALADHVAVLEKGKIALVGMPSEIAR